MKKLFLSILLLLAPTVYAQTVVNTMSTAGSTVTVTTATAHGLVVNQGFCLGTSICAVVLTVPTSTTLTFNGNQSCSGTCPTIQAAKQIIVLQTTQPSPFKWNVGVAFWLTTAQGVPVSRSNAWPGTSTAESNALGAGSFIELVRTYTFSTSLPMATVKAILQSDYNAEQATISQSIQPGQFFGVYFNGTWSQ
jgi:hypothetical protein